jgi:hypothetical protein
MLGIMMVWVGAGHGEFPGYPAALAEESRRAGVAPSLAGC